LRAELLPVGELENLLVDGIVAAHWRLRRLRRVESGIFAWELYGELAERAQQEARTYESNLLIEMGDPMHTITDEQKHQEALSKVQEMKQAQQDAETATLGRTFIRDADEANAFSKLSRYETTIERNLYKALHELQLSPGRPPHGRQRSAARDHRRGRLWRPRGRPLKTALFGKNGVRNPRIGGRLPLCSG
jgi:hypothetical protein